MTDERNVEVFGKVTDFDNNPLQDAVVEIKNDRFEAVYKARTNVEGEYRIRVKRGLYLALMACKDYKTKYLEYWAWNVPAYQDLQFNPRIGGIEVYAMNAFSPQGAYPSLLIYFRPMSLIRSQRLEGVRAIKRIGVIDISPVLSKDDIQVRINGRPVEMLEVNRVKEYADGIYSMIAYLVQLTLPKRSIIAYLIQSALPVEKLENKGDSGFFRVDVTLKDTQTGERGEGCCFWRKQQTKASL